jgi:acyl-CoA hydrolase
MRTPRLTSIAELARGFRVATIYLPGCTGEPTDFVTALEADPELSRDLSIETTFIPGINRFAIDTLHESARVSGLFMQPAFRAAQREGRFRHLPLSYSGYTRALEARPAFDACVVAVSPPNAEGECSLGAAVEFTEQVLARAKRRIAIVNANMPFIAASFRIKLAEFDAFAESSAPLKTYQVGAPGKEAEAIARTLAGLIDDGAALQVGLGKVPDALCAMLHDRRGLRLHSGMLSDGVIALAAAGALDRGFDHKTCVMIGSPDLYAWAAGQGAVAVRGCAITHDPARLATIERFVAVNSALEVDLFGQCDLETADGRAVSGAGGAPDFARAASRSRGGLSVIALPSSYTSGGAARSRIVGRLRGIATIGRVDVDCIVTEHGAADLRGRSVHERAEALIAIAAPAFQSQLTDEWRAMRDQL